MTRWRDTAAGLNSAFTSGSPTDKAKQTCDVTEEHGSRAFHWSLCTQIKCLLERLKKKSLIKKKNIIYFPISPNEA